MKTLSHSIFLSSLAYVLVLGSSCKKEAAETAPTEEIIIADTTKSNIDSVEVQDDNNIDSVTKDQTEQEESNAKAAKNSKSKTHKSLEGYSAPDGTDAENHDGDQYTKNDQRLMPSGGTSIK